MRKAKILNEEIADYFRERYAMYANHDKKNNYCSPIRIDNIGQLVEHWWKTIT